jgi:hypothetical protein
VTRQADHDGDGCARERGDHEDEGQEHEQMIPGPRAEKRTSILR